MERITWDQFFMAQSHLLAFRSTCTRLSVGATIVRENRIIAGGYNGSITGGTHCIDEGCYVVGNHCVRTIHAEINALLQCAKYGSPVAGSTLYVTHFPCLQCTKAIIQAGIQQVNYATDYKNDDYAIYLFEQAGIQVNQIPFDRTAVDFLQDEKEDLVMELLQELRQYKQEPLTQLEERVNALFGKK